jgi:ATP-dependent DNA helicase RecG
MDLSTNVKFIKRIGERVGAGLAERGISTVEDLLYHLPFRYEDRLHPRPLSTYNAGDMASLVGEVRGTVLLRTRSAPIFEMTVGITPPAPDSEAAMQGLLAAPPSAILETVKCMWFHGTYLKDKFRPGQRLALYGKLEGSRSGNALGAVPGSTRFKMVQPTFEILPDATATGEDAEFTMLEMGRIVPIYESLGGKTPWGAKLTSRWLRRVMWTVFRELGESNASAEETLPLALRTRLALPSRMDSLQQLHFPPAGTSMSELISARSPAHRRLIFEEFFFLELGLELKRRRLRDRAGTAFVTNDQVRDALKQVLPFKPTSAQKRVLGEIVTDMRRTQPMRRLLQGDVGSGKTIVAFQAALIAIENGYQAALMAPTEILATQHYLSARRLLAEKLSPRTGRPYRIALLTGSLDDRTKRETRARIFRGEIDLAIGTHALVEDKVDFANLGLVIVDEQHRFGVQQRFQLMRKPSTQSKYPEALAPDLNKQPPQSRYPEALAPDLDKQPPQSGYPEALAPDLDKQPPQSGYPEALAPDLDKQPPQSGYPEALASGLIAHGKRQGALAPPNEPDVLVMTATPIPRTLALTLYGDLEVSVIDELPPGRTPIATRRMTQDRSSEVWDFVRKQVASGRQAYIVYPLIEGPNGDQPELDFALEEQLPEPAARGARKKPQRTPLRSATDMHAHLSANELAGLRLGLLHGRMSADDKEVTMARFKRGELDVLVSTTVIEVGVDVPNATLMVIEHADRFGLAQLHQLRGRVGRGAAKSFCVLLHAAAISPEAELRLDAMVQTQDGFALAELDLQQRGPGEFFGTKQAGLPEFRVANLARDRDLLELAKQEAALFVDHPDPTIPRPEIDAVWSRLKQQWQRRYGLVEA